MGAVVMVIWFGVTPNQLHSLQAAQPAVYKADLVQVEQRAMAAERVVERSARSKAQSAELPSSMR